MKSKTLGGRGTREGAENNPWIKKYTNIARKHKISTREAMESYNGNIKKTFTIKKKIKLRKN